MKFKIDENLPVETAGLLIENGYFADTVYDEKITGSTDAIIYELCCREKMVIITLDLDFADIRNYNPVETEGIIVLRLFRQDKSTILKTIKNLISYFKEEPLKGKLWIVEKERIRIR